MKQTAIRIKRARTPFCNHGAPLVMTVDPERTRLASAGLTPGVSDDGDAFLQERLAYVGKVYAVIGISFYLAGNVADVLLGTFGDISLSDYVVQRTTDLWTWVVPVVTAVYVAQWARCRRGRLPLSVLRWIDSVSTLGAASLHSLMVFAQIPGEVPGLSYARALLLFTFGLLIRSIVVPSSARRTLILGLLAGCAPVITSRLWFAGQPQSSDSPVMHVIFTGLWCLGTVVIATFASHVIFGLRQQVREASQLGQYTLLEKIGEGGMGAVYRATHAMLRRPTAVKLLPAEKAGAVRLERFEREVQLTSRLTHPNTVAIFDYGRTPDGVFYYAMEYLEGLNLEDLVRIDGPQPASRVVHILRQVAASLAEAHGIGLIHRDIKPANVILVAERGGATDVAKVVDFGLVKELNTITDVTGDNQVEGTPHYFAPETLTSPDDVGPQTDLYSLGCVGYFLLTGHTVFAGRTAVEVCGHHLHSQPVPPAERLGRPVPATVSAILMSCLDKAPAGRPSSAHALVDLLDGCTDAAVWTHEMGRSWWALQGRQAVARVREKRAGSGDRVAGSPSVPHVPAIGPKPLSITAADTSDARGQPAIAHAPGAGPS
jgi:eukaryotic-like serine/threonine-protein kinase